MSVRYLRNARHMLLLSEPRLFGRGCQQLVWRSLTLEGGVRLRQTSQQPAEKNTSYETARESREALDRSPLYYISFSHDFAIEFWLSPRMRLSSPDHSPLIARTRVLAILRRRRNLSDSCTVDIVPAVSQATTQPLVVSTNQVRRL